jgi:hypothetical protein
LAEKVETILRRNVLNTRPRDFYDIYILSATQKFDKTLLREAIQATSVHRGTADQILDADALMKLITESTELKAMWGKYQRQFSYASDISYEQVVDALRELLGSLQL